MGPKPGAAILKLLKILVGTTGFEPATSSVSRKRSNQLSYAPVLRLPVVYQDREGGGRRAGGGNPACLHARGEGLGADGFTRPGMARETARPQAGEAVPSR